MNTKKCADEEPVLCLKIGCDKGHIEELSKGYAWFSQINTFIEKAEEDNNNERGDKYEGMFARYKKGNPMIDVFHRRFGSDLQIIEEGDYCLLRRISSRSIYAFCMYGIKISDLVPVGDPYFSEDGILKCDVQYEISDGMYENFFQNKNLSNKDIHGYYCSADHILHHISDALKSKGYRWEQQVVNYDIDLTTEFCIKPEPVLGDNYLELLHKRTDLQYQHEIRFLICDCKYDKQGIKIYFEPLSEHSSRMATGRIRFKGVGIVNTTVTSGNIYDVLI